MAIKLKVLPQAPSTPGPQGPMGPPGPAGTGTGDVIGPGGAIADDIAVYDGATGKLIKDGGKKISDLALASAVPVPATALPLVDATPGVVGVATKYAREDHVHPSDPAKVDVSGLSEAVDDRVAALLVAGTNITLTYNDPANTLTVASTASGTPATAIPLPSLPVGVVGVSTKYAREDHVHPGREILTANRTYFVRTDGNDANTGLVNNAGGAFLTIQRAMEVIASTLDTAAFTITIQVGDGTYNKDVKIKPWLGGGPIILQGNAGNNTLVNIDGTGLGVVNVGIGAEYGALGGSFLVRDLRIQNWALGASARFSGRLQFTNCYWKNNGFCHICPTFAGMIELYGGHAFEGNTNYWALTDAGGTFSTIASDLPVMGNIAMIGAQTVVSGFTARGHSRQLIGNGITFSGVVPTGKKWDVFELSYLRTNAAAVPGSVAGTPAIGAAIAGTAGIVT